MVCPSFFNEDACTLAKALLGKIIRRKVEGVWLSMRIIETEAYYLHDKASHASLITTKRLGIPRGRDEHLPYRFVDAEFSKYCTKPFKIQL